MKEQLPIKILKYLKAKEATYKKIDIGEQFIIEDQDTEQRKELKFALIYLKDEGLIDLNGDPIRMLDKVSGVHPSKYHTGLTASITLKGVEFLKPKKKVQKQRSVIHMQNVHNPIVNSPIANSHLVLRERSNDDPAKTPISEAVNNQKKSWSKKLLKVAKWAWDNIEKIIIAVMAAIVLKYFKLK